MPIGEPKKTCDERIDQELKNRIGQLLPDVDTWTAAECVRYLKTEGQEPDAADIGLRSEVLDLIRERAIESLLSVEKVKSFKLCLSWGGPADYFELDWSVSVNSWIGGRYLFQDWFDGAIRPITAQLAEQLAELYGICPEDD